MEKDLISIIVPVYNVEQYLDVDSSLYVYVLRPGSAVHGGSKLKHAISKPISNQCVVKQVLSYSPQSRNIMIEWGTYDCIHWKMGVIDPKALRQFKKMPVFSA